MAMFWGLSGAVESRLQAQAVNEESHQPGPVAEELPAVGAVAQHVAHGGPVAQDDLQIICREAQALPRIPAAFAAGRWLRK